jgi:hypothetical protein
MPHGVLDVLQGHAGAEQLGGKRVPEAVGADLVGRRDAGSSGQAADELVGDRVAEALGAVGVEEQRAGRALADAVLEGAQDDGGEGLPPLRTTRKTRWPRWWVKDSMSQASTSAMRRPL